MEFEDILSEVGGYGKYQKYLTLFFLIPVSCIIPLFTMDALFMVSVPEHWCFVAGVAMSNLSVTKQQTLMSPSGFTGCYMYDINYTEYLEKPFPVPNETDVTPCTSGWQYDKINYDSTAATKWNMVCDHSYFPSLILTIQNIGSLLLTPIFGYLADRFGRKTVYLLLALLCSVTELASVLVEDIVAFAILRAIHGGVMPTMFTLSFLLILEIVAPDMRAHMNGIINCSWTAGLCFLPLIAYLSRTWINLGLVGAFACACNLLYWRFVPESPCWLISMGKYEEATTIMEKIGERNGKPQDRIYLLKQLKALGQNIKNKKETEKNSSPFLMLKYPRIRKHFLILSVCWTAFYVTYFGMMYNLRNLAGNEFLVFFLLSIVEVPGNVLFWILMDRAGRRWSSAIGFIVVGFICFVPLTGFENSDIICSMIGKFISTGIFMVTDQQGSELFPTVARSFGVNLGKTLSNTVTLFLPFFADLGGYSKALPFVVMGCTSLVAGILASFLPETQNENLPQTLLDAEEFGKDRKFFSWIRRTSSDKCSTSKLETDNLTRDEKTPASALGRAQSFVTSTETEKSEIMKLVDGPLVESTGDSDVVILRAIEATPMLNNTDSL